MLHEYPRFPFQSDLQDLFRSMAPFLFHCACQQELGLTDRDPDVVMSSLFHPDEKGKFRGLFQRIQQIYFNLYCWVIPAYYAVYIREDVSWCSVIKCRRVIVMRTIMYKCIRKMITNVHLKTQHFWSFLLLTTIL